MKYLERVIGSGLLSNVKKTEYITAFEQMKISGRSYKKNEKIFLEEDIIDRVCIVDAGSVRSEKIYPTGEIHIVDVYDEGAIFGLEIAASRTRKSATDFISNEETRVVFISMASIEKSSFEAKIRKSISYMLADENIRMAHKIEILAERGLRNRIMTYLRILQKKAGSGTVTVPMSREQMAQFLCVNRSALSNELNVMKREGIIDFRKGKFMIPD